MSFGSGGSGSNLSPVLIGLPNGSTGIHGTCGLRVDVYGIRLLGQVGDPETWVSAYRPSEV